MAKEGDLVSKGFLVKGSVPHEPRVPIIDYIAESRKVEVMAIVSTIESENTFLFDSRARELLSPMEQKIYGTACIRYENGKYGHINRWKGKKESNWEIDDPSESFKAFQLDFRTKRRKVSEVEAFRAEGVNTVGISLQDGAITKVSFDCSPWLLGKQLFRYPRAKEWLSWFDANSRILNSKGLSRVSSEKDRSGIVFDIQNRSLEVYTITGGGSRWTYKSKYEFNALEDRFNEKGDNIMRKTFMKESLDLINGIQITDKIVRDYAGISKYNHDPVFAPEEFTRGLELLLDTIPLD